MIVPECDHDIVPECDHDIVPESDHDIVPEWSAHGQVVRSIAQVQLAHSMIAVVRTNAKM